MKFLFLLLSLIILTKTDDINITPDNQTVKINASGVKYEYNLSNYKEDVLYIISNIASNSTGGIIVNFETNDKFKTSDDSFYYGIGETENEALENCGKNKIRALKKTLEQDMNTFSTLYFIKDNNKYGCLKVTGLDITDTKDGNLNKKAKIEIYHESTTLFVIFGFGFVAVVLIVALIVFLLCKKILKLRDQ